MQNYSIRLKRKYEIADRTMAFVFERPADFDFRAGQYVVMTLSKLAFPDNRAGKRSLSIASAPYEDELLFAMRMTESGFKRTLSEWRTNDDVSVTQAVGHFVLDESERPAVFLIGGIGITPVRSMMRQAVFERSKRAFFVFYSNRRSEDMAFRAEMQEFSEIDYHCIDTLTNQEAADACKWQKERGYICRSMIDKYLTGASNPVYYIVGSPAFAQSMRTMLEGNGVANDSIKQDPFTGI
jgi:ferredoxin-NADP reductase